MIPITRPVLGDAETRAVARVMASGWLAQGPEVTAFEQAFATTVGAPHACAVANCTVALHMALLAAGVGLGDEVITVSHSFVASSNTIRQCGATPVFVDIDPDTFNIDVSAIPAAITPRTRAILCVHQIGMPCDIVPIVALAHSHGLLVIEDAACAIGSAIRVDGRWESVGRPHGDIACFSLHPRKILTTGEGGMLTTANPEWDRMFRLWRQHGMSVPDIARHRSAQVVVEDYPVLGFNYRMTDMQAAIGLEQLKRLPEILSRRRVLAANYRQLLKDVPSITVPLEPAWARSNWQSFCIRLPDHANQRTVMQAMLDRGVATRRGVMCIHLEPAYADIPCRWALPHSEAARDRCILLPLFPDMTSLDQRKVVAALTEAVRASISDVHQHARTAELAAQGLP